MALNKSPLSLAVSLAFFDNHIRGMTGVVKRSSASSFEPALTLTRRRTVQVRQDAYNSREDDL